MRASSVFFFVVSPANVSAPVEGLVAKSFHPELESLAFQVSTNPSWIMSYALFIIFSTTLPFSPTPITGKTGPKILFKGTELTAVVVAAAAALALADAAADVPLRVRTISFADVRPERSDPPAAKPDGTCTKIAYYMSAFALI